MESLYKIDKIDGKDLGWIALKDIKSGTLIGKEKPQFILKRYPKGMEVRIQSKDQEEIVAFTGSLTLLPSLMDSFNSMTKKDQEEFLKLDNAYSNFAFSNGVFFCSGKRPDKFKTDRIKERMDNYLDWKRFSEEVGEYFDSKLLFKIWCIYESNHFEGDDGICFRISRLNHSCSPNAVISGNDQDTNELEVRASTKILKGQEITLTYVDPKFTMKNLQERQEFIYIQKGFVCSCEVCKDEETKDNVINDFLKYEKFQRLYDEVRNTKNDFAIGEFSFDEKLDLMEKVVLGRKQMYNFVKTNYPKDKRVLLHTIIKDAFFDAERGYSIAQAFLVKNPKHLPLDRKKILEKMEHFKQECAKLSKVGYQISKMIFGDSSMNTKHWKEFEDDFENWSKKFNQYINDKKWFKKDRKYSGEMERFYMPYSPKESVEPPGQIMKYGKVQD